MKEKMGKLSDRRDKKIYNEEMVYWSSTATDHLDFNTKKDLADGLFKKINESLKSFDHSIELNITFDKKILKTKTFFQIEELSPSLRLASDIYFGMEDAITNVNCLVGQNSLDIEIVFNEFQGPIELKSRIQTAMKKNANKEHGPFKSLECYISGQKDGNSLSLKFSTQKNEAISEKVDIKDLNNSQSMDAI